MRSRQLAVEVRGLVKRYDGRRVVDEISFDLRVGETLALLGPNGAGKTTTVEILEGYRRPDAGSVSVLGLDPWRDGEQLKPRVGLMLQQGGVYPAARPIEMVRLFASFFERPCDPVQLLELVGLTGAARTRFRLLSGGQKQRLLLALALVGRPKLLFLDEPTAALDPQARRATWNLLRDLKARGVSVLLTTHFMDEAEQLADRVAIIDRGRLLRLDSPRKLVDTAGAATGVLHFRSRAGLDPAMLGACFDGVLVEETAPGQYQVATSATPSQIAALANWLRDNQALLEELRTGHRTLEDVFLALTGRELRD